MKKSEFLCMVQHELNTIKEKATKEEIEKLNFYAFNHDSSSSCIYGQMTGYCRSIRANELYPKNFDSIGIKLDNKYVPFTKQAFVDGAWFTPLEKYLFMVKEPQHKKLIQYLKGEIETIKL